MQHKTKEDPTMCTYNVRIDDAVMEEVRPSIAKGMVTLSERLRGLGRVPVDFDYKKELASLLGE